MNPTDNTAAISTITSPEGTVVLSGEPQGLLMPQHVAAVVPFQDHEDFSHLHPSKQQRVSLLLQLFAEMATAPDGLVACSERLAVLHPTFSASHLRTLYYSFKKRGWRALAKIYIGPKKLAPEFVQEVRRLIENNKVSARAAIQLMKDDWADGKPVKGYGTWQEYHFKTQPEQDIPERYPFGFFPRGWSESNLYEQRSSKPQRTLKQRGFTAAKRYLPHVIRDTSQLRPLELITIDDFELDFLVRAFNPVRQRWEICRCAGLVAIDVATRRKLAVALVPRFKLTKKERASASAAVAAHAELVEGEVESADEKRTRISISRADVQSLMHAVFSEHGRPLEYGCTVLCENATAAITADFEWALDLLLGVQVARTGLLNDKTLANGFVQKGGKPWEKGWLESLFHHAWGALGAALGYKGSNYIDKPADHEAALAYSEGLLKLCELTPEVAARLRLPFFTIDQALDGLNAMFARIEQRTDHRIQGFRSVFEYRRPGVVGLLPESALASLSQEQVLECEPVERRETCVERWNDLVAGVRFGRFAPHVLACLLLTPKKVTFDKLRITFTLPGRGGFTFADADSPVMQLPDKTELLGYLDLGRPGVLHVTDMKGCYIGTVKRRGGIDIRDAAAISEEAGEISRLIRKLVVNPVRERHAAENAQLGADAVFNQQLLKEHNLLPDAAATPAAPGRSDQSNGAKSPNVPTVAKAPLRPASLSRRLAQAPARDAFTAYQEGLKLAQGIAADVGRADQRAALERQTRADAEHLSADDIEAATGRRPTEPTPAEPQFSAEEISNLLRADPKK